MRGVHNVGCGDVWNGWVNITSVVGCTVHQLQSGRTGEYIRWVGRMGMGEEWKTSVGGRLFEANKY